MEVIDNRKPKLTTFEDIEVGEIFYDPEDLKAFCLKIEDIKHDDYPIANAVSLSGIYYVFSKTERVERVRTTINIYNV